MSSTREILHPDPIGFVVVLCGATAVLSGRLLSVEVISLGGFLIITAGSFIVLRVKQGGSTLLLLGGVQLTCILIYAYWALTTLNADYAGRTLWPTRVLIPAFVAGPWFCQLWPTRSGLESATDRRTKRWIDEAGSMEVRYCDTCGRMIWYRSSPCYHCRHASILGVR